MAEPKTVVVRVCGGDALVRWVVGATRTVAYITTAVGAEAVRAGREPEVVIGFPRSDVFLAPSVGVISDGDRPDWSGLEPFFP